MYAHEWRGPSDAIRQMTPNFDVRPILKVVLCDCAVALALRQSRWLQIAQRWRIKLAVTDLLFERELRDGVTSPWGVANASAPTSYDGVTTGNGKEFRIERLAPETLQRAIVLRAHCAQLSLLDACTLSVARERAWFLATKNAAVARAATELGVEAVDFDWLCRELLRLEQLHACAREKSVSSIEDVRDPYGAFEHSSG